MKASIFFSGAGGEPSHHCGVPHSGSQGHVSDVRMEALEAKNSKLKDLIVAIDEANTSKEKSKTLSDDLRAKQQLTLEKDEQLLAAKVVEAF